MREDIKTFYYNLNLPMREHCTTLIMDHFDVSWSVAVKEILLAKEHIKGIELYED